jgi:hypothetical protein
MEEKKNSGQYALDRLRERDKERSKGPRYTTTGTAVLYPLHSGGWQSASMLVDFLESLKDSIRATVSEELRDGKGNRYPIEDYDTFLTHAAAAINDYQNWETILSTNIQLFFTLYPLFLYSPEASLFSLDPESFLERIDLPPVVVPSFKLEWGSSQARDSGGA